MELALRDAIKAIALAIIEGKKKNPLMAKDLERHLTDLVIMYYQAFRPLS